MNTVTTRTILPVLLTTAFEVSPRYISSFAGDELVSGVAALAHSQM